MFFDHANDQTSWFSQDMLKEAVQFAKKEALFDDLTNLYSSISEGKCSGCAACCMESVETHLVEFLQIYNYLNQRPEILQKLFPSIVRYYMLEGVEKKPCPFQLEDKRCAIYPVRPLPCRLFGHWSKEGYEANYEVTSNSNKEIADYYKNHYQLALPEEVVNYKVPYCNFFEHPRDYNTEDFYDLLDGIMAIQSKFLNVPALMDLLSEGVMTFGLITWLMGVWFDLDELQEIKIEIMSEFLKGKDEKLNSFIRHRCF